MKTFVIRVKKSQCRKSGLVAFLFLFATSLLGCGLSEKPAPAPAADGSAANPASNVAPPASGSATTNTAAPAAAAGQADPFAPPNDEQIKKDVVGRSGGVLEVKLADEPGKKEWSSAHSQYFWEKNVTVRRNPNLAEFPNAVLLVGGFARYDITSGEYHYREFKVTWNEYEGMPRPTDEQAIAFIKQNLMEFLGGKNNSVVHADKIVLEMAPAEEQEWTWHSPKSVSFNVHMKCDEVVGNTEIQAVDYLMEARFYRDDAKQDWQRVLGFEKKKTEGAKQKSTQDEINALKRGA